MKDIKINIKELSRKKRINLQSSQLILEIEGSSVCSSLVNTLRRLPCEYVPTYAFPCETIYIDKNTSIYNNDMMKIRLSQFTVPDITNDAEYLEPEYYLDMETPYIQREKNPKDNKVVELYINAKNESGKDQYVTTNDSKVLINGIEVEKFDKKFPHLVLILRPDEVFNARCVGVMGIGIMNDIWASCPNCYFEELTDTKFKMTWESNGQMDEYVCLIKSCKILKKKCEVIKQIIDSKYNTDEVKKLNTIEIDFENETYTMGGIINELLQDHDSVKFSGVERNSHLRDVITIKFETVKPNPIIVLFEVIDHVIAISNIVRGQLEKLYKDSK